MNFMDFTENQSGYPGETWLDPANYYGPGLPSFVYWVQTGNLRAIVFNDPNYLLQIFDFYKKSDNQAYFKALEPQFPSSPDLSAFARKGGKLIEYHGWGDSIINAMGTVNFYEQGAAMMGGVHRMRSFNRLFMVPGTTHCCFTARVCIPSIRFLPSSSGWRPARSRSQYLA